jgi:hypothetical protein
MHMCMRLLKSEPLAYYHIIGKRPGEKCTPEGCIFYLRSMIRLMKL